MTDNKNVDTESEFSKEVAKLKLGMLQLMEILQKEGVELVNETDNFKMSKMTKQKIKLNPHGKKIKKVLKKSWQQKKLKKQEKFEGKSQVKQRE